MTSNIIGWAIIVIISIVGWLVTARNNSKAAAEAQRIARETAANEMTKVQGIINNLPCIKDTSYEKEAGRLEQKVDNLEKHLDAISKLLQTK